MNGKQARAHRRQWHSAAERAHTADVQWFACHPERRWMVRPVLLGEFPREVRYATHVLIVRDAEGDYHGKPLLALNPRDYPTGRIPQEHREMADALMGGRSGWVHAAHFATDWAA